MSDTKREATTEREIRAARKALAGLAGLLALYIRDLPADEAKRVQELTTALVANFDQHAARRGQA